MTGRFEIKIQKLAPKNKNDGKFNKPTKEYEWGFALIKNIPVTQ